MKKPQIILASASTGRKDLLEKLRFPFSVILSEIDEDKIIHPNPYTMLQHRAHAKAENVKSKLLSPFRFPLSSYLIIAADSMAILGSKTFGKAANKKILIQILTDLMGKTHIFATATTIILMEKRKEIKRWENISKTRVTLCNLTDNELNEYINRYDFSPFAAGYSLGETPWDLITKIDGSYTNVIGLPFEVLLPILRELKII